ncbi:MAG: hypothetical protein JWP07_850 [Pseudonocardiales bacterium]|nr:hypothetical protein [Pseudonocardiales bacterium]
MSKPPERNAELSRVWGGNRLTLVFMIQNRPVHSTQAVGSREPREGAAMSTLEMPPDAVSMPAEPEPHYPARWWPWVLALLTLIVLFVVGGVVFNSVAGAAGGCGGG